MLKLIIAILLLMTLRDRFHLCYGDKLKCDFSSVGFKTTDSSQYNGLYSCQVTSLDNSNIIDGYTGVHKTNKNVSDVKAIWIHHTNTKLIPDDIGQLFNLIAFSLQKSQLIEIKSENFLEMQELEVLSLRDNSLTSLPSNAFSFLPKLRFINLNRNQLSEIPSRLFTNNLKLEQIHLNGNKINFLGTGVFDELTKLNMVDLQKNICEINQLFNLISFSFDNSQLIEIKADNFLGMQSLEVLRLRNNSLTSVSSNTFSFLPKLRVISLNRNQLSEIPSGLFTNNLKLEQIHLYGNIIKFLSSGVFDGLTKLNIVDLQANICEINQLFEGTVMIGKIKNEMKSKCKNPNDPHEIIINLKEEKKELIKGKEAFEKEKNALKKNYDALKSELSAAMKLHQRNEIELIKLRDDLKKEQSENLKVKNERNAWIKEKDALMMELSNKTSEINELKTNCKNSNECEGAVEMKFNEIMNHLSKASQEHQMECNELIKLRAELVTAKDELKNANDQQKKEQAEIIKVTKERDQLEKKFTEELTDVKKELIEAKETIQQKLPKLEQTIEDFYMEVMDLKIERHNERQNSIALRSKLMEAKEQLAECKINERSLV